MTLKDKIDKSRNKSERKGRKRESLDSPKYARNPRSPKHTDVFTPELFGKAAAILNEQLKLWEDEYAAILDRISNDPARHDPGGSADSRYDGEKGVPTMAEGAEMKRLRARFSAVYGHEDQHIKFGLLLATGMPPQSAYLEAGFPAEGVFKAGRWARTDTIRRIVRMACEAVVPIIVSRDCELAQVDVMAGDHIIEKINGDGEKVFFPIAPILIEGAKKRVYARAGIAVDEEEETDGQKRMTINFICKDGQAKKEEEVPPAPVVDVAPVVDDDVVPAVNPVKVNFRKADSF